MKRRIFSLALIVTGALAATGQSHASTFTIDIAPDGSGNVVATGSGSIDFDELEPITLTGTSSQVVPNGAFAGVGSSGLVDVYGPVYGPKNFGSGGLSPASTSSGDAVFISGGNQFVGFFPDYESNEPLSGTATWTGATIAGLGLTPGTYTWTWGSAVHSSFVLDISPDTVPEPGQYGLFVFAAAGAFLGWNRFSRRGQLA